MQLMHVHSNINCVLFWNEYKEQNLYLKDMLSITFERKQTTQNFSSKQ